LKNKKKIIRDQETFFLSFSACPEGFNEFFNQRRRWMPSTIANIFDLLSDAKNVVKRNKDISYPYICYQVRCCWF
jgi:chitin synthase